MFFRSSHRLLSLFPATRHSSHPSRTSPTPPAQAHFRLPKRQRSRTTPPQAMRKRNEGIRRWLLKNAHTHHTTHTHTHTHTPHHSVAAVQVSQDILFSCKAAAGLLIGKAEARTLTARTQTLYANTSKHLATLVSSLVDVFPFDCALALRATLTRESRQHRIRFGHCFFFFFFSFVSPAI